MSDMDLVKRITEELCENTHNKKVLERYFAPTFTWWRNGVEGDLSVLTSHMADFEKKCDNMTIPNWGMIFETEQGIVVS